MPSNGTFRAGNTRSAARATKKWIVRPWRARHGGTISGALRANVARLARAATLCIALLCDVPIPTSGTQRRRGGRSLRIEAWWRGGAMFHGAKARAAAVPAWFTSPRFICAFRAPVANRAGQGVHSTLPLVAANVPGVQGSGLIVPATHL
eukprot:904897-Prymnesium_polylepis.1